MMLDNGTLLAIIIALAGSLVVMLAFWKQNVQLTKENNRLRIQLREERRKIR